MTSPSPMARADRLDAEPRRAATTRESQRGAPAARGLAGWIAAPLRRLTRRLLREVACGSIDIQLPDGEPVLSDERYFLVQVTDDSLSRANWTAFEREVMVEHRWWSREELAQTELTVWPENLVAMLEAAML